MIDQNNTSMIQNNGTRQDNVSVMKTSCIPQETVIKDVELAHAYVPYQILCNTFTPIEALKKGTAFPPLYDVYGWERNIMGDSDDD